MPWGWITGEFHSHPKRRLVGVCADGLLARAISRAAEHMTDGFVEESWVGDQLAELTAVQRRSVLELCVRHRVLEPIAAGESRTLAAPARPGLRARALEVVVGPFELGGYLVHDFLHFNRARAEVEEKRRRDREKKATARAKGQQGTFDYAGPSGVVPEGQSSVSPGASPLRGEAGFGTGLPPTSDPPGQNDARAPELAGTVADVMAVLGQCDRLQLDVVGVENAIAAWPGRDPVVAARGVVAAATDPAFRWTNGARLLYTELQRAGADGRAPRLRRASSTTAADFLALRGQPA